MGSKFTLQENLLAASVTPHTKCCKVHCKVVPRLLQKEKGAVSVGELGSTRKAVFKLNTQSMLYTVEQGNKHKQVRLAE